MLKVIATVIVITSTITCSDQKPIGYIPGQQEFKTKTGKTVIFREIKRQDISRSKAQVFIQGFKPYQMIETGEMDPVQKVELTDLDKDGFEELCITTQSAGSGSAGTFYVYSFDKDIKSEIIKPPDINEKDYLAGGIFEGYMGHDSFSISADTLIREFPVYKAGDSNAKPTGGTKKVFYMLTNGKLEIVKAELKDYK